MSSSEPTATLELHDSLGFAQLTVADARLFTVAHGVGRLQAELEPGLYRLEASAAGATTTRLIEVMPGETRQEVIASPLPSAAPVEGTSTSHEYHQDAASYASGQLTEKGGTGLVVVVRTLRGRPGGPLDDVSLGGIELSSGYAQFAPPLEWERMERLEIAVCVIPLPPGGYSLTSRVAGPEPGSSGARIAQAINVMPGHQTLVFVPNSPVGPRLDQASIHLASGEWTPFDPANLATEAILQSLVSGQPAVSEFDYSWIPRAPMLGVLAVHASALSVHADLDRAQELVSYTQTVLMGGPDAAALPWVIEERRARDDGRRPAPGPSAPAFDPPMLRLAYDALLRWDAVGGDPFGGSRSSSAEIADRLIERGCWTSWLDAPHGVLGADPPSFRPQPVTFRVDLADIGSSTETLHSLGPAARGVVSYLVAVAEASAHDPESAVSEVSERQVAVACRLPLQTVRRAHEEITSMLVPA